MSSAALSRRKLAGLAFVFLWFLICGTAYIERTWDVTLKQVTRVRSVSELDHRS